MNELEEALLKKYALIQAILQSRQELYEI